MTPPRGDTLRWPAPPPEPEPTDIGAPIDLTRVPTPNLRAALALFSVFPGVTPAALPPWAADLLSWLLTPTLADPVVTPTASPWRWPPLPASPPPPPSLLELETIAAALAALLTDAPDGIRDALRTVATAIGADVDAIARG